MNLIWNITTLSNFKSSVCVDSQRNNNNYHLAGFLSFIIEDILIERDKV